MGGLMETVECQVTIWDRGQARKEIVDVEVEAIRARCWRPIAAIKAAVLLELPFTEIMARAKFGFRREDKERLFGKAQEKGESA